MADSFIPVGSDPSPLGRQMQTVLNTVGANSVHAEAVIIVDPNGVYSSGLRGGNNMANNQVATSTTAATLVAARPTRRSVTIRNLDATISIYIGVATVSSSNGMLLKAGESISVDYTGLIQVISASGTPTAAYMETYD